MLRVKILLILSFFAFFLLNPSRFANAQLEQNVVRTIVGEAPEDDPDDDIDPGPGPGGFVFYCQYGKVNAEGSMAPGGDSFWNRGGCNIYGSGCGPTSIAMIVSSFGKTYTPIEVSNAIPSTHYNAGIGCQEGGTFLSSDPSRDDIRRIDRWLDNRGFNMSDNLVSGGRLNLAQVRKYLDAGAYIGGAADMQYVDRGGYSGRFSGHFFVITGIDESNNLRVMDPTFCRLNYIGGRRRLTDVNNTSLRGRTNISRWMGAWAIKPKS